MRKQLVILSLPMGPKAFNQIYKNEKSSPIPKAAFSCVFIAKQAFYSLNNLYGNQF